MNSGTNNTKWTSWTSLKKKPFPQMDDGESPEQPGLMPPGSPKSGGRLKRMLSNSKLSKFVQAPPNATLRDVDPEAKPRQRYNSFSRSFFGRSKPGFLPPSPPLSDTSTPDLSPSTSASSSSSSSFVSATLLQQSPYQRLELLPQITLDSNEPWALQSQQAISKEPRLEPALPIREPSQRQPGKTSPTKEKGRTKTNKSVWEISSESEGETESDVLHFQKRVTKNKPTLTTLQIPPSAESKRLSWQDRSKRMSSSTASITSSSPPPSPSLCGSRALYNHTCAKIRESAVPFAIDTMPSSTAKLVEGRIPKKLGISLQRQALLRKLGSPFAPGTNLTTLQQREIAFFMPRSRPSATDRLTSPIAKPLLEFDTPASTDNEALMSTGMQGKSVAELKSSPLLIWIERPVFSKRMVEYTPSADALPIENGRSAPFRYTHVIQSQIALHCEHAAQAKRMQEKRRSNRLSRLQNLSSSPQEYSPEILPAARRPQTLARRAQSTPAAPLARIVSRSEEDDELPLARLISPKSSTSPVKVKVKIDSTARDQKRLSATLPPNTRSQSLPRLKVASSQIRPKEDIEREFEKMQAEKAIRRRSALLQSPVTPTESTSVSKRNSLAFSSIPEGLSSMPEQRGRDRRRSLVSATADATEKRRSQLLTSPPSSWSTSNLPELAHSRPKPLQTASDQTKRRSQGDTRRYNALPVQPFFTEVVLPLQGTQPQYNNQSFPWLPASPAAAYQYTQPLPRNQSFQSHSASHRHSVNLSSLGNSPINSNLARSWSTPDVTHRQ